MAKALTTTPAVERLRIAALSAEVALRLQLAYEQTRSLVMLRSQVKAEAAVEVYGEDDSRSQTLLKLWQREGETLTAELEVGERKLAEVHEAMLAAEVATLRLHQLN